MPPATWVADMNLFLVVGFGWNVLNRLCRGSLEMRSIRAVLYIRHGVVQLEQ